MLLEAGVWFTLNNPELIPRTLLPFYRHYYNSLDREIIQVTGCAQYDSLLFYRLKPGACSFQNREFHVLCKINRLGFRDSEHSLQNPDVVVLGDSFAMGWGVEQTNSFPERLEQSTGLNVLNTGISSFGTAREVISYKNLPGCDPQYVVIQYHTNDHAENLEYIKNGFFLPVRSKDFYDSLSDAVNRRQEYFLLKHQFGIAKSIGLRILRAGTDDMVTGFDEADAFLRILSHHVDVLAGKQIIVFKVDDMDKLNDDFVDAVDSLSRHAGNHELDITTLRISHLLNESDFFTLDDHLNASGHRKIADAIKKSIIQITQRYPTTFPEV